MKATLILKSNIHLPRHPYLRLIDFLIYSGKHFRSRPTSHLFRSYKTLTDDSEYHYLVHARGNNRYHDLNLFPLLGILSLLLCIPCALAFDTELLPLLPPYHLHLHLPPHYTPASFPGIISILGAPYLISDLDIETCNPDTWDCKDSKYVYPAVGHCYYGQSENHFWFTDLLDNSEGS